VIAEVARLNPTALTVIGLPVLTWAAITVGAIGVRTATVSELQVQTPAGLSISLLLGIMLGGVSGLYLATEGGYPVLWITVAYVTVTGITVLWYWFARLPNVTSELTA
jgi:hypothetical protein